MLGIPLRDHSKAEGAQRADPRKSPHGPRSGQPLRTETLPMPGEEFIHKGPAPEDRAVHQVSNPQSQHLRSSKRSSLRQHR